MFIKSNQSLSRISTGFIRSALLIFISTAEIEAQNDSAPEGSSGFPYLMLLPLALILAGAVYWWLNKSKAPDDSKSSANGGKVSNEGDLDGDKELEWLRKNQQLVGKKANRKPKSQHNAEQQQQQHPKNSPNAATISKANEARQENSLPRENEAQSSPPLLLPIFSVVRLELARPFDQLPISGDEDLISAIEQSQDEFEEDEEVRDLSVRVLTAFKTRNSVEALSQIALYDLSSSLRSKAVNVLSEFDHESVFETILLSNADPTREVRATAARGLTKLTFDRADAWSRIAETAEEGRMAQAARAAIESGFVDRSFDRLVHPDRKNAYEAFALMALLIKAGETEKIFNALATSRDANVQRAILHTIKVTKNRKALDGLYSLVEKNNLPVDLQEEVDRTIEEIDFVTA